MKMILKISLIILSILLVLYFITDTILYKISYHVQLNYGEIESITLTGNETGTFECTDEKTIKKAIKEIKNINFYPSKVARFEQSPISFIRINYKNGVVQNINIVLLDAMIYTSEPIRSKGKFYYIKPYTVDRIIKKLKW